MEVRIDCATNSRPLMLAYWGRLGPLSKMLLDLALSSENRRIRCTYSYSTSNELSHQLRALGDDAFGVPTFEDAREALFSVRAFSRLRKQLLDRLTLDQTKAFVSLMPHVWSPLVSPVIHKAGIRHIVIVHDADPHPGDWRGLTTRWLLNEAKAADHVVTLSNFVAQRLIARGFPRSKISVLFHPDLDYSVASKERPSTNGALRILFAGRILPYKGLDLLVAAVELLREEGFIVELGVCGRGEISTNLKRRLLAIDAEVTNRWVSHEELALVMSQYDVVAAPHTEASQSGVISAAFGACLPVVSTTVGGLSEQIIPHVTGLLAASPTPKGISDCLRQLVANSRLLEELRAGVLATRQRRSPQRFLEELSQIALQ